MNDLNETCPFQPSSVDEATAATPQNIGRYRVERVLGKGGFGLVYLAYDEQLHRPVAIKVPHPRVILRKAWGGSRSWVGARAQAVLMSVWRTCWQRGRSALDFLSQLLRGNLGALVAPP